MKEKEYYKEKIIEQIKNVERTDILAYLDRFIENLLKFSTHKI